MGSWGTIPTRSLFDFAQDVAQEDTNNENIAEKDNVFEQTLDYACALVLPQLWPVKSQDNISCQALQWYSCDEVQETRI